MITELWTHAADTERSKHVGSLEQQVCNSLQFTMPKLINPFTILSIPCSFAILLSLSPLPANCETSECICSTSLNPGICSISITTGSFSGVVSGVYILGLRSLTYIPIAGLLSMAWKVESASSVIRQDWVGIATKFFYGRGSLISLREEKSSSGPLSPRPAWRLLHGWCIQSCSRKHHHHTYRLERAPRHH